MSMLLRTCHWRRELLWIRHGIANRPFFLWDTGHTFLSMGYTFSSWNFHSTAVLNGVPFICFQTFKADWVDCSCYDGGSDEGGGEDIGLEAGVAKLQEIQLVYGRPQIWYFYQRFLVWLKFFRDALLTWYFYSSFSCFFLFLFLNENLSSTG